jgi:hypothetical protein
MKGSDALVIGASSLVLAGCASLSWEGKEHRVLLEDDVGGRSAAKVETTGDAVRVQVAQFAEGCRLQTFLVGRRTAWRL